jgi:hypothetical protein
MGRESEPEFTGLSGVQVIVSQYMVFRVATKFNKVQFVPGEV